MDPVGRDTRNDVSVRRVLLSGFNVAFGFPRCIPQANRDSVRLYGIAARGSILVYGLWCGRLERPVSEGA